MSNARPSTATMPPQNATEVVTLGCRLNSFESEVMSGLARDAGLDNAIIINSCAVTSEAERQTRQEVRRARRKNPQALIVVTGCAAQIDAAKYAAMDEVDHVIGNQEKLSLASFQEMAARPTVPGKTAVADIMSANTIEPHLVDGIAGRARAFVQVQTGCDHRCTFCIIPFGRGASRSLTPGEVSAQLQRLVDRGCNEAVLSGVDITSYGSDLPGQPKLGDLVAEILNNVPGMPRLRLTSLDPAAVDQRLLGLIADEPRLMPHFHLSVQAGDDLTLKRMKRRHLRADVIKLTADIRQRRPDAVFGADLIAGFPTETEEMHQSTEALIDEAGLTYLHVFPYSPRHGTPAASMPMVALTERRERAARLRKKGAGRLAGYLQLQIGRHEEILVETKSRGRTKGFANVVIDREAIPGTVASVRISNASATELVGERL